MRSALEKIGLEDLGLVRMRGTDIVQFLQGQLSNDVARLTAERSVLAGYHNPQGRTIALLRLVHWGPGDFLAIVPRELAGIVASRLAKFVLRAKVKIADESPQWLVSGLVGACASPDLPAPVGAQARVGSDVFVRVGDEPPRWLVVSPSEGTPVVSSYPAGSRQVWQHLEVAAGQPQVYAATSEEFVAQMLNLDVLNAIAFDKGCYTGQEVIARAHYRGRVKRRMRRFVSRQAARLAPGDSGQLADGRAFKVVLAAQLGDGRCDFLAVVPVGGPEREGAVSGAQREAVVEPEDSATPGAAPAATLGADQAELPYALPD